MLMLFASNRSLRYESTNVVRYTVFLPTRLAKEDVNGRQGERTDETKAGDGRRKGKMNNDGGACNARLGASDTVSLSAAEFARRTFQLITESC